jgi:hypothetical protein
VYDKPVSKDRFIELQRECAHCRVREVGAVSDRFRSQGPTTLRVDVWRRRWNRAFYSIPEMTGPRGMCSTPVLLRPITTSWNAVIISTRMY